MLQCSHLCRFCLPALATTFASGTLRSPPWGSRPRRLPCILLLFGLLAIPTHSAAIAVYRFGLAPTGAGPAPPALPLSWHGPRCVCPGSSKGSRQRRLRVVPFEHRNRPRSHRTPGGRSSRGDSKQSPGSRAQSSQTAMSRRLWNRARRRALSLSVQRKSAHHCCTKGS